MKMVPLEDRETAEFRRGGGCEQCLETGFSGRILGRRTAHGEPALSRRGDGQSCRPARCSKWPSISGMQTMWQRGLRRALTGQTTLEEILRVISVDEL